MIFVKVLVLVREDKSKELRKIVGMVERFHNLVCVCDGEDHDDRKTEKVAQKIDLHSTCVFT